MWIACDFSGHLLVFRVKVFLKTQITMVFAGGRLLWMPNCEPGALTMNWDYGTPGLNNGRDNRVTDFALMRKGSSHASSLVLTLDGAIPSGHVHQHTSFTSLWHILYVETSVNMHIMWRHAWQAQILDVFRHVLLLQHPSNLDEVIIHNWHLWWDILIGIYWIK